MRCPVLARTLATSAAVLALLLGAGSVQAAEITLIQYDPGSAPEDGRWDTAWASLELALCGNDLVEGSEECDDGNTDPGDCCSPTCQYESAATVCRHAAGICDAPDNCDGAGTCTADAKLTSECRAAASACDAEEVCDGVSPGCPPDLFLPAGTECRASAGVCDPAWFCDGVSLDCDPLIFPAPMVCRASTGVCDPEERCDGSSSCPPDIVFPPGTVCRASAGVCDVAEVCDGVADHCAADQVLDGVPCPDGNPCNGDEMCEVGTCVAGTPLDCDDGNVCTADGCDEISGCAHDPICSAPIPTTGNWGRLMLTLLLLAAGAALLVQRRHISA